MSKKSVELYEGNEKFTFVLKYDGQRTKDKRTFICQYNDETFFREDSDMSHIYWKEKIGEKQENLDVLKKYLELEEQLILKYGESIVFVITKYKGFIKLYVNSDTRFFSKTQDLECFKKVKTTSIHLKGER
ncbi:MAG: hypothetical protein ACRC6X_07810 [Culicoidibacterales bacterium]